MGNRVRLGREVERYLVRVGHEEREACLGQLLDQHVAGRLSAEELDRRQQAAMEAVTVADLERLTADLPPLRRARRPVPVTGRRVPGRRTGPREPGRTAARLAVPATGVAVAGLWLGNLAAYNENTGTVLAAVTTGAVGAATGWWAGRRR